MNEDDVVDVDALDSDPTVAPTDVSAPAPAAAAAAPKFTPWVEYSKRLTPESSVAMRNKTRKDWLAKDGEAFIVDYAGAEPVGQPKASRAYREWKARRAYAADYLEKVTNAAVPIASVGASPSPTGLAPLDATLNFVGDVVSAYAQGAKQSFLNTHLAYAALSGDANAAARLSQAKAAVDKDYATGRDPQSVEDIRQQNERVAEVYKREGVQPGRSEDLSLWSRVKLGFDKATTNPLETTAAAVGSNPVGTAGTVAQVAGSGMVATGAGAPAGAALIAGGKVAAVASGAATGGAEAAASAFDAVMAQPIETLRNSDMREEFSAAYAKAISAAAAQGMGGREAVLYAEGKARAQVAASAAVRSTFVGGVVTGALEAVGAKFGSGAIAGQVGKTAAKNTAVKTGVETTTEGLQGAGIQANTNSVAQQAGDDRGLGRDLVESFIEEAAAGAMATGGVATVKAGVNAATANRTVSPSNSSGSGGATQAPAGAGAPTGQNSGPSNAGTGTPAAAAPTFTVDDGDAAPLDSENAAAIFGDVDPTDEPTEIKSRPADPAAAAAQESGLAGADGGTGTQADPGVQAPVNADITAAPDSTGVAIDAPSGRTGEADGVPGSTETTGDVNAIAGTTTTGEPARAVVSRSDGIPERGAPTPLGTAESAPAEPDAKGEVAGAASPVDPERAVGLYNPTETGIFPGDEAAVRAVASLPAGRQVTVKHATDIAKAHAADYNKYADAVNAYFGEPTGYRIPTAQFVNEFTGNILATAAAQGLKLAPSAQKRAKEAQQTAEKNPNYKSTDRRARGDRRDSTGAITPEARWQTTPQQNAKVLNDAVKKMPGWRGEVLRALLANGKLVIAANRAELPPRFAEAVTAQESSDGGVGTRAFYSPTDKVAFVLADRTSAGNLFEVVLHELGAHGGLQRMLSPQQLTQFAARINEFATGGDPAAKYAVKNAKGSEGETLAYFAQGMARLESQAKLPEDSKLRALWEEIKAAVGDAVSRILTQVSGLKKAQIAALTPREVYELTLGALQLNAAPAPVVTPTPNASASATPAPSPAPLPPSATPAPRKRGRPSKPVTSDDVPPADDAAGDLTELDITKMLSKEEIRAKAKTIEAENKALPGIADTLATIEARGNAEEIALAQRMAAVGDPLLNGVLRRMAADPEKYQQYVDATDVRGVEFSLDYRDIDAPLTSPTVLSAAEEMTAAVRTALFDAKARAVDVLAAVPARGERLVHEYRTADNVYKYNSALLNQEFVAPLAKDIKAFASEYGVTADTAVKDIGYVLTAIDVPRVNKRLIDQDAQDVADGKMTVAAAAQRYNAILAADGAPPPNTANGELGVAGGMSDPQAAAVIARFNARYPGANITPIADRVYALNARALVDAVLWGQHTTAVAAEFSNPTALAALRRAVRNPTPANRAAAEAAVKTTYVPMTGNPDGSPLDFGGGLRASTGGATALNQPASRAAEGRASLPVNGLSATLQSVDAVQRHVSYQPFKREMNKAWQDALGRHNGDPDAAYAELGWQRARGSNLSRASDSSIIYRDAGASASFVFKDPRVAEAITGNNLPSTNAVGDFFRSAVRTFSALATVFNPFFAPPNAVKDVAEKVLRLRVVNVTDATGKPIRSTDDIAPNLAAIKYIPAATAAAFSRFMGGRKVARTDADLKLQEFLSLGGSSLFGESFADGAKSLDAMSDAVRAQATPARLAAIAGAVFNAWNSSFEHISSLTAYMYLRGRNVSPVDAAAATLELMNFGKRGTVTKPLNSFIPFVGPALIGAAALVNDALPAMVKMRDAKTGAVVERRSYAGAVGLTAMTAALTGLAVAMSGRDDEDELGSKLLNSVPTSTVERSLPVRVGDSYVKAPIPFGAFMLSWGAAVEAARYLRAETSVAEFAKRGVVENAAKHLTPLRPPQFELEAKPLQYAALSATGILTPAASVALNINTFGSSVTPAYTNKDKPLHEQALPTMAPEYVAVSRGLSDVLGVDVHPNSVKTLVDGYTPGLLGVAKRVLIDEPNKERIGAKPGVSPALSAWVASGENDFAAAAKAREYEEKVSAAERAKTATPLHRADLRWLEDLRATRREFSAARRGVTDPAALQKSKQEQELATRKLVAAYRKRHGLPTGDN